ncbi:MAG: UDP-3-O-(3-hydroxymyristoyl)glucosamine N-acyltransferase [Phycisphaerales bacterium]|nr:UDP-3-O-(3-hydroxymyristoyl)glucosamine N-acyltransferase [Phycisphaerales bacterium]
MTLMTTQTTTSQFTAASLAERLGGKVIGDGSLVITGLMGVDEAQAGDATLVSDSQYVTRWHDSNASACVVSESISMDAPPSHKAHIVVPDAELAMADLLSLFAPPAEYLAEGIDPSAVVDSTVQLGEGVSIGPGVVLGRGVKIGDRTRIFGGVQVYSEAMIGDDCEIHSNTVIRSRCEIGNRVILHQCVAVGADGFGFRPATDGTGLVKMPHIGSVRIEDDVEIGANSCIDRGKFGATVIGAGTKLDNLVQIGHNVQVGRCCVICGQVGVAGSVHIGDGVMIGAQAGITGHLDIEDGAMVGAQAGVIRNVVAGDPVHGTPAQSTRVVKRQILSVMKLPDFMRRVEKHIKKSEADDVAG